MVKRVCYRCEDNTPHHVWRPEHLPRPFLRCSICLLKCEDYPIFEQAEPTKEKWNCFECWLVVWRQKGEWEGRTFHVEHREHEPASVYRCDRCNHRRIDYFQFIANISYLTPSYYWHQNKNDLVYCDCGDGYLPYDPDCEGKCRTCTWLDKID